MQRRPWVLAVALLALFAASATTVPAQEGASGIGVSPATLLLDDPPLMRGGGKVATLQFQQHEHELAHVEIQVHPPADSGTNDHGDASSWITIVLPDGQDPAGTVQVPQTDGYDVQVEVAVPETAANGGYAARLNFRVVQACDADGGACVGVQAAASATIRIEVQDVGEVKRILVTGSAQVHNMEAGGPFQFTIPLENTGNVDANPAVKLEILDKFQEEVLAERTLRDLVLSPGERGDFTFIVDDLGIIEDQYWARVLVYLDAVLVHETGLRTFDVVPPGTLAQLAELLSIRIDGDITSARVGDLVRLEAMVENTGAVPIVARFQGAVRVDGQLVDTLESASLEVPIGQTRGLEIFYRVAHTGQHVFEGRVHYGAKVTEERSLLLAAVDADSTGVPAWVWFTGAALVPLALVGMFLLGRRGGTRPRGRSPPPPRAAARTAKGAHRPRGRARPGPPGRRAGGAHAVVRGPVRKPPPRSR